MKKIYYSIEEQKAVAMDALRKCASEATKEQTAHFVRAYDELFTRMENTSVEETIVSDALKECHHD